MVPIVAALVNAGLGILGSAVASKGKEFIQDKLNVDISKMLGSEEGKIQLAQLEMQHEQALQQFAIDRKNQEIEEIKIEQENTANARDMQKTALQQTDTFSKRFLYYFSWFWSASALVYIFAITFFPIAEASIRFADTILGFLLGTIVAQIINFFYGSSKSSKDKDAALSEAIKGIKQ